MSIICSKKMHRRLTDHDDCQVRRKRRRLGAATDPGLDFYVPSSPTSVDANPSSETAEPRSASSEDYDVPQRHSPMEVDNQLPLRTPGKSSGSPTPTPMLAVEDFLRESAGGSRKRRKLRHVDLGDALRDTSHGIHPTEEHHPSMITQPLTSTAPRRKRKNRSRFSRVKAIPVKGKAYRARSQKPKAVTEDLVRTALATHVDVDEEFLEDERQPQSRLVLTTQTNDLAQNTPATFRRRNLVNPSKTQPFPCEASLGNASVGLESGLHPRKPMTAWEGALALSKLDIRMPASTSTPRRKGRPIQGPSSSRTRGRYPKLPLTPLSPTPKPSPRGHLVPSGRYDFNTLSAHSMFCLSDAFTFVSDADYIRSVGHQDRRRSRKSPRCQRYPPRKSLHPTLDLDQNTNLDQAHWAQ